MKVILGLGNPGRQYEATRHNVGWWLLDHLADVWRFDGWKRDGEAMVTTATVHGVRQDGGVLDQTLRELEVEVDPSNIPSNIEIDVTPLKIGDSIHVRDVKVPEGVEVITELDSSVCVVSAPRAVVEETPATEEAATTLEPEVIRKAKTDEDEEEAEKK